MTTLHEVKTPASREQKRLIYISTARIPTGKAHGLQIMYMCEEFARAGATVELVIPGKRNFSETDPFEYYKVSRNFTIRRIWIPDLGSKGKLFPRIALTIDICAFALGIVFTRTIRAGHIIYCRDFPLLFLCAPRKVQAVIEVHDISRRKNIFRAALNRATNVVAITRGLKDALIKLGIAPERIIVAADGVRLQDFENPEYKETARKRLGLPLDKKIALYIGRIDTWKGTNTFFEAAKFFPADVRAVVMGSGPLSTEQLAKMYPHVTFLGERPYHELADNQAAADVLVLPNSGHYEVSARYTSPLKLFTYMTSDIPIVASDLPSIREVLDESSAYFFVPDNADALAQAITSALGGEALSRAARAREMVNEYTWSNRAQSILSAVGDKK